MSSASWKRPAWLDGVLVTVVLVGLLGLARLTSTSSKAPPQQLAPDQHAAQVAEAKRVADEELADCQNNIAKKRTAYIDLIGKREYWPATLEIRRCAELLQDEALSKLVADAEVKSYLADIQDAKLSDGTKLRSVEALIRDHPSAGSKYLALRDRLTAAEAKRAALNAEEAARQAHLNRFSQLPAIGSSKQQVINAWGYPQDTHTTVTAHGQSDMWVYGRRYLHFSNDVLTAIQH